MIMDLEDVITTLEELEDKKITRALTPVENTNEQYVRLGEVAGVRQAKIKFVDLLRRESY